MGKVKMAHKKEIERIIDQAKDGFKKLKKEVGILAKRGEKEIIKASKAGRIQLDIMSLNVQREKLYYDLGKKVAGLNMKKALDIPELESYWRKMNKLEEDIKAKKELLARVRREGKK